MNTKYYVWIILTFLVVMFPEVSFARGIANESNADAFYSILYKEFYTENKVTGERDEAFKEFLVVKTVVSFGERSGESKKLHRNFIEMMMRELTHSKKTYTNKWRPYWMPRDRYCEPRRGAIWLSEDFWVYERIGQKSRNRRDIMIDYDPGLKADIIIRIDPDRSRFVFFTNIVSVHDGPSDYIKYRGEKYKKYFSYIFKKYEQELKVQQGYMY